MDLIILAAGLSSRLSRYTHDIIPKYLVNIDNNTGLYHIINYWGKYCKKIYLIIHSKFHRITDFYINNVIPDFADKIEIIHYNSYDGTAFTLHNILNNQLKDKIVNDLCITWCDIFPKESLQIPFINKKSNNIFVFTNNCNCRYYLSDENKIINSSTDNGNIVGIYYFQNYKPFTISDNLYNQDIVDFLDKIGDIYNYKIDTIIDYGDEHKLNTIIQTVNKKLFNCRYFNNIIITEDNKLLKTAINKKGQTIINHEKNWYLHMKKYMNMDIDIDFIPIIYEMYESGFLMEYKEKYIPLYQYFNNNGYCNSILLNVFYKIKTLHELSEIIVEKEFFFENLKIETFDKVVQRKNNIQPLLEHFGKIKNVNNVKIYSFEIIMNKCSQIIYDYYQQYVENIDSNKIIIDDYRYNIIHGDCQFSNILINEDNNILFIDPRGYFGNSSIYGLKEYDYAKILYSLYGFDNFNADYFIIDSINSENIEITIKTFFTEDAKHHFENVHVAFMIIIWLSLADYIKNDIWKCVGSYYYGLYLGTILLF